MYIFISKILWIYSVSLEAIYFFFLLCRSFGDSRRKRDKTDDLLSSRQACGACAPVQKCCFSDAIYRIFFFNEVFASVKYDQSFWRTDGFILS